MAMCEGYNDVYFASHVSTLADTDLQSFDFSISKPKKKLSLLCQ